MQKKNKIIKIILLLLSIFFLLYFIILNIPRKQKSSQLLTSKIPKQQIKLSKIQYPLSELSMSGTIFQEGKLWGIVRAPDHHIYFVKAGDHIGSESGEILEINSKEIKIQISENKNISYFRLQ